MKGRPVTILGAGPAGLVLAAHLKKLGLAARLIEQGPTVGTSWHRMPRQMKLNTPWLASRLSSNDSDHASWRVISRAEFAEYLETFAQRHQLEVVTNCHVQRVERTPTGFVLQTTHGEVPTSVLVNATGYFHHPRRPLLPGLEESGIPTLHSADYEDPEQLTNLVPAGRKDVLIVGRRISAGQIAEELWQAGWCPTLSCHHPIPFGLPPAASRSVFPIYFPAEDLFVRLGLNRAGDTFAPMAGGLIRQLILAGRVPLRPRPLRVDSGRLVFEDGSSDRPALILFATGFQPCLGHLPQPQADPLPGSFESRSMPGLFFLGLDRLRTFRSRFLRGLREDAMALARILAVRLRWLPLWLGETMEFSNAAFILAS